MKFIQQYRLVLWIIILISNFYISLGQQDKFNINSLSQNQVYLIDSTQNVDGSILKMSFTNNFIQQESRKNTFLCFLVLEKQINLQDSQWIYDISEYQNIDLENCLLQLTQIINIALDTGMTQVYINPIFLDEFKAINKSKSFSIDTTVSVKIFQESDKCGQLCGGGTCTQQNILQPICTTCPINKIGVMCDKNIKDIQINKQYSFTFHPKEWYFFSIKVDIPISNKDGYHIVIYQKKETKKSFNIFWNQQVKLYSSLREAAPLSGFDYSYKRENITIIDETITKEFIQEILNQKSITSSNASIFQAVFIINFFNNNLLDQEVVFAFYDDVTYQKFQLQQVGIFDLPVWVFYLMMGFAIIFLIAILCLVRALVKRYQEEQNLRIQGNRRNLEQLKPEVVDSLIPKYTFKHIFKAVKRRKQEVLKECQQQQDPSNELTQEEQKKRKEEHEEISRKVQERCENILSNGECGICLCDFEFDEICRLTICDHIFHVSCFDPWLYKNQNCPYCRTSMTETALKEWKQKTQQQYPLDQTLGSVATLDSKKASKVDVSVAKPGQDTEQPKKESPQKIYDGTVFAANLVQANNNPTSGLNNLEPKLIYFHSLSLQSLKEKDSPSAKVNNNRQKKKHFTGIVRNKIDPIKTKVENYNKTTNDKNQTQENQEFQRKNDRASTLVTSNSTKKDYQNEPKSAHLAKIMRGHEQFYQDTYSTAQNNSPDYLTNQQFFKNGFDFKGPLQGIHEGDHSEASTRIRNDSNIFSINGENLSNNKLFQHHDSSSKLNHIGNYNLNLQDSILKGTNDSNDSPRLDLINEKPTKASKFKLSSRASESNQDLDSIINLDQENDFNEKKENPFAKQNSKIGKVEQLIDEQKQLKEPSILKKHISANIEHNHHHFHNNQNEFENNDDEQYYQINPLQFNKTKSQNCNTVSYIPSLSMFEQKEMTKLENKSPSRSAKQINSNKDDFNIN